MDLDKNASIIQLWWLEKKLINSFNLFSKLLNEEILSKNFNHNGLNFNLFINFIREVDNIEIFDKFFGYLFKYYKRDKLKICDTKKILTIYTIKYYPDVMNSQNNKYFNALNKKMTVIMDFLSNINQDLILNKSYSINLINNILNYIQIFDKWKEEDLDNLIYSLSDRYTRLQYDIKEFNKFIKFQDTMAVDNEPNNIKQKRIQEEIEYNNIIMTNFNKEKKDIVKKIKKLGSKSYNRFIIFNKQINNQYFINELTENINKNMVNSYWDIIEGDISRKEPDYSKVFCLLEECKKHLYLCVKNRPDIHSDINNNIDIELLKCYMDSGDSILIKEHIFNLFDYINNKIQEFQSRHEDKTFIEFNKKLNEYKNNNSLEETVILYLKEVMPRLSNIVKSKEIFMEKIKTV